MYGTPSVTLEAFEGGWLNGVAAVCKLDRIGVGAAVLGCGTATLDRFCADEFRAALFACWPYACSA